MVPPNGRPNCRCFELKTLKSFISSDGKDEGP